MSKKSSAKAKRLAAQTIVNRRARFDYELGDEIVAGLSLTGLEVRAAREGHVQLKGAYRCGTTSAANQMRELSTPAHANC